MKGKKEEEDAKIAEVDGTVGSVDSALRRRRTFRGAERLTRCKVESTKPTVPLTRNHLEGESDWKKGDLEKGKKKLCFQVRAERWVGLRIENPTILSKKHVSRNAWFGR